MIRSTKITILLGLVTLFAVSSCYKKFDCVDRHVCVMFYKGTDTSVIYQLFQSDTSFVSKSNKVLVEGYDYIFILDSTYRYTIKIKNKNYNNDAFGIVSNCIPQ